MSKPIIVLEVPHQRDAFAWIAWNGESEILDHAHEMESDNHRYSIYTLAELQGAGAVKNFPARRGKLLNVRAKSVK